MIAHVPNPTEIEHDFQTMKWKKVIVGFEHNSTPWQCQEF